MKFIISFDLFFFLGMEAKFNCCEAIYKAIAFSPKLLGDPALSETAEKV